jgi:hypothetical protein
MSKTLGINDDDDDDDDKKRTVLLSKWGTQQCCPFLHSEGADDLDSIPFPKPLVCCSLLEANLCL